YTGFFILLYHHKERGKKNFDFFLFVWRKEEEMAKVALVFLISMALFLSIRSVVAEESPAPSPMDSDATTHSQSWGDWFGHKLEQYGIKSKDDNAGAPAGEPIGAPASA
ncbi:hypothetical protein F2P56_012634, partial [Juglans regia]